MKMAVASGSSFRLWKWIGMQGGENGLECRMSVMKMEIFRTAWGYALFAVVMTIRVSSD